MSLNTTTVSTSIGISTTLPPHGFCLLDLLLSADLQLKDTCSIPGEMARFLLLRRSQLQDHLKILTSAANTSIPRRDLARQFCSSGGTSAAVASSSSSSSSSSEFRKYLGYTALVLFCGAATYYSFPFPADAKHKKAQIFRYAPLPDDLHTVSNWSGTHEVQTRVFHQPETLDELEKIVKEANESKSRIRPVGSGLSPNGIGLSRMGMVNLALMDRVLEVDKEKKTVTVQAGIRVQQLVDAIKDYGLTLQNFASIREQQIGGIVQVLRESSRFSFSSLFHGQFRISTFSQTSS